MNHQKENKLGRVLYKGMKTGISSVMKTTGLDSGTSKHAAAVVIDSALGFKAQERHAVIHGSCSLRFCTSKQWQHCCWTWYSRKGFFRAGAAAFSTESQHQNDDIPQCVH